MTLKENLKIEYVDINIPRPVSYNPRTDDAEILKDATESISRFGIVDPLILNSAKNLLNNVIGGHLRLKIAKMLGYSQIPVVYVNIPDPEKEKELNLRLNKNLGKWD
ncbi:MAG: ParB N-terminal domain-containing protein, partial [Candidatus Woesebacteria bacterium]|nr:ParB N-terminal domain-containing protein [Candidatus Woesebacteria bacterium]